jgi:hypothetical protein
MLERWALGPGSHCCQPASDLGRPSTGSVHGRGITPTDHLTDLRRPLLAGTRRRPSRFDRSRTIDENNEAPTDAAKWRSGRLCTTGASFTRVPEDACHARVPLHPAQRTRTRPRSVSPGGRSRLVVALVLVLALDSLLASVRLHQRRESSRGWRSGPVCHRILLQPRRMHRAERPTNVPVRFRLHCQRHDLHRGGMPAPRKLCLRRRRHFLVRQLRHPRRAQGELRHRWLRWRELPEG